MLTDAAFLLNREGVDADPLFAPVEWGVLKIGLEIEDHLPDLRALMRRYLNHPISLADACLVRMASCTPTESSSDSKTISASIAATATKSFPC